jgi:hypothetical protein
MYAEPTIPNTSLTPCATSVSTNASEGVIFCLPVTARFLVSVMMFISIPRKDSLQIALSARVAVRAGASMRRHVGPASQS